MAIGLGAAGHQLLQAGLAAGNPNGPCQMAPVAAKFIWNGQEFSSMEELRAAMQGGGFAQARVEQQDSSGNLERISTFLSDKTRFDQTVTQLYQQYDRDNSRSIGVSECKGLCSALSVRLGIDNSFFENVEAMVYRFDYDGNGTLGLNELEELITFLLRAQKRMLDPPKEATLTNFERKNLKAEFTMGKKLGQGGQGAVYLATVNATGAKRVVKFYDKSGGNVKMMMEDIKDEFELLKRLDHPNVARICEAFEDYSNFYVVSEPYTGGDLTTLVEKGQKAGVQITHQWIGRVFLQIMEGIAYLHSKHVMHCDLKEPNAMITDDDHWDAPSAILIDFGMAKNFSGMREGGTPGYMPPEFWQNNLWTPKGDMFALAVTFWCIYNPGKPNGPFCVPPFQPPFPGIQRATCYQPMDCRQFPSGLREIVEKMACKDFKKRPTAQQVLGSTYFQNIRGGAAQEPVSKDLISGMMKAAQRTAAQNLIAVEIANQNNLGQMKELNDLFRSLDGDASGKVEGQEMLAGLVKKGFRPDQAQQLVESIIGDDGKCAYSEFMGRMITAKEALSSSALAEVFQSIDQDGSGTLSRSELNALMERKNMDSLIEGRSVDDLIAEMDIDGDGVITFQEFKEVMLGHHVQENYAVGDQVEYNSPSAMRWIPCEIIQVDNRGRVQVSVKPGAWMDAAFQQGHLRRA